MLPPPHRGHRFLRVAPAAALTLALLGCPPASAGPTERLSDFFAAVNSVLADPETEDNPLERVARICRLVAEVSAVNEAAAVALGREWQVRSPGERDEFVALFAQLLERAYVGRLAGTSRVSNGVQIAYLGESVAGDEATVQTALDARDGGKALVEYRMVNRQGRWHVRDLVLDGVSIVENYRAQFRRVLSQVSYQDLVGQVRAKLSAESIMFARVGGRIASVREPSPTELVLIARPADRATDSDRWPPAVRAAAPVRSREFGWSVDAATVRSRDIGWNVDTVWYWVRVAAFKTATAAARLAERLSGGTVVSTAGGRLLQVHVGPFAEHAQAVSKLHDLEALGYHPLIAKARD